MINNAADQSEDPGTWVISLLLLAVALVVCAAVGYYLWARIVVTKSVARADSIELTQTFKRWAEAGRPEGDVLNEFMQGRRQGLVVSNCLLTVQGIDFIAQFAMTNLHGRSGTLFVSTNGALIWLPPSGVPEAISPPPGR